MAFFTVNYRIINGGTPAERAELLGAILAAGTQQKFKGNAGTKSSDILW